jgi:hypothetical protein
MKGLKTGGRGKGTPNKRSMELREKAEALGVSPFEIMLLFAMGNEKALGYEGPQIKVLKDGGVVEMPWITPEMRLKAAAEAASYLYPKLKAIEHSGSVETSVAAGRATKAELIEAIKTDPFIDLEVREAKIVNEPGS